MPARKPTAVKVMRGTWRRDREPALPATARRGKAQPPGWLPPAERAAFLQLREETARTGTPSRSFVAERVTMAVRWEGKRQARRSYLREILDLAAGTGRRITAVCSLRPEDLQLPATPEAPHGAIRWPAATDKMGRESTVPISPTVRAALIRTLEARGIAMGYLFPHLVHRERPVDKDLVRRWLRQAEALAELEPQQGSAWHAYRRGWATARKHLPLPDVAAAGGWKGTEALQECYLHPDPKTVLAVVLGGAELREVKQA